LKEKGVVREVSVETSSKGNDYVRVRLHSGLKVDYYSDGWKDELLEFQEEYEGLIVEVYYEDRGYTFGKAIVPASPEKAGELLDRKSSDLEKPSDKMMRGWKQWVDLYLCG